MPRGKRKSTADTVKDAALDAAIERDDAKSESTFRGVPVLPVDKAERVPAVDLGPVVAALHEALHEVARAIREVGLALVAQERLPAAPVSPSRAAAVSLPPASPPEPRPSRQGEHGGSPKQSTPPPASATLQEASQAVLAHSAKHTAPVTAGLLKGIGVTRVSLIEGTPEEKAAKYAQVVAVLS